MTEQSLSRLRLTADEREQVATVAGDLIAVQVYRELQSAAARASDSGFDIPIPTACSCSSKKQLLAEGNA